MNHSYISLTSESLKLLRKSKARAVWAALHPSGCRVTCPMWGWFEGQLPRLTIISYKELQGRVNQFSNIFHRSEFLEPTSFAPAMSCVGWQMHQSLVPGRAHRDPDETPPMVPRTAACRWKNLCICRRWGRDGEAAKLALGPARAEMTPRGSFLGKVYDSLSFFFPFPPPTSSSNSSNSLSPSPPLHLPPPSPPPLPPPSYSLKLNWKKKIMWLNEQCP